MTRDLSRLFRPRHIAIFGGGFWGPNVVEQCRKIGFDGQVWPVHPTRDEIHGLPCFRAVEELPEAPDASFVGVNRNLTIEIVEQLARRGAGGRSASPAGSRNPRARSTAARAFRRGCWRQRGICRSSVPIVTG